MNTDLVGHTQKCLYLSECEYLMLSDVELVINSSWQSKSYFTFVNHKLPVTLNLDHNKSITYVELNNTHGAVNFAEQF
jgi:hypothetical protein